MVKRFGWAAVVVALVGALGACSSSGNKGAPKASSTTRASSTSAPSTSAASTTTAGPTTTGGPSTSAPAPPPTSPAPDGETAARRFFAAWLAHNDAALAADGAAGAVTVAKADYSKTSGGSWVFSNCQGAAGSIYCTWVRPAEDVVVRGDNVSTPHLASDFQWNALDAAGIAGQLVDAWQAGSTGALQALATSGAYSQLQALQAHSHDGWQAPSQCDGTAGSLYCTYTAGAHKLVIQVGDVNVPHQVIGVTYS